MMSRTRRKPPWGLRHNVHFLRDNRLGVLSDPTCPCEEVWGQSLKKWAKHVKTRMTRRQVKLDLRRRVDDYLSTAA